MGTDSRAAVAPQDADMPTCVRDGRDIFDERAYQFVLFTAGGVHEPSRTAVFGQ
jgi:hypothetical protein